MKGNPWFSPGKLGVMDSTLEPNLQHSVAQLYSVGSIIKLYTIKSDRPWFFRGELGVMESTLEPNLQHSTAQLFFFVGSIIKF